MFEHTRRLFKVVWNRDEVAINLVQEIEAGVSGR